MELKDRCLFISHSAHSTWHTKTLDSYKDTEWRSTHPSLSFLRGLFSKTNTNQMHFTVKMLEPFLLRKCPDDFLPFSLVNEAYLAIAPLPAIELLRDSDGPPVSMEITPCNSEDVSSSHSEWGLSNQIGKTAHFVPFYVHLLFLKPIQLDNRGRTCIPG